ncbi:MAG: nuclear transport factor 2 family protein [Bacteroidota bacterium]
MKQIIQRSLLLALTSIAIFITPLKAQDATKELATFTKKFQDAYNKKDDKALKPMYTDDAIRVGVDGTSLSGNEAISAEFAKSFAGNKQAIVIKQDKVEPQTDGSAIATGTYHVTGSTNAGEKIERSGNYTNTVIKVKGQWKISKSVLTSM